MQASIDLGGELQAASVAPAGLAGQGAPANFVSSRIGSRERRIARARWNTREEKDDDEEEDEEGEEEED